MEVRWKQTEARGLMLQLQVLDGGSWKAVPMVGFDDSILAEHPRDTYNAQKKRAKAIAKLAEESRSKKKELTSKAKKV